MSFQPGLCAIYGNLVAAWKDKPSEFYIGTGGTNEGISYAQFDGETWQLLGTIPGVTNIGVSLASDENDYTRPTVYGAWKGAATDVQGYFSALPLVDGQDPLSRSKWQLQTAVNGAGIISGPSIACLQSEGPSAAVYLWAGYAVEQTGPFGEFTVWYVATVIDQNGLSEFVGQPQPFADAASANCVQIAVAGQETLYVVWFDNNTKNWRCNLAQIASGDSSGVGLTTVEVMVLPNYANAAGYSMTNFDFGPQAKNPIYVAWMDESNHIFGSSFDNLVGGGVGTPIPGASGQAATLMGCGLAELGETLYAVWPDLSGQLCYASSSDGLTWEYLGIIAGATSGPDLSHPPLPTHQPPIRVKV